MKDLKNLKFNLTSDMANDIIIICKLKEELELLKKDMEGNNDLRLVNKHNKLEKKLNDYKKKFINKFKESNKDQIIEYHNLKDSND